MQRTLNRERNEKNPNYSELCRRYLADARDFSPSYLSLYNPFVVNNNGSIRETEQQLEAVL